MYQVKLFNFFLIKWIDQQVSTCNHSLEMFIQGYCCKKTPTGVLYYREEGWAEEGEVGVVGEEGLPKPEETNKLSFVQLTGWSHFVPYL